MLHTGTASTARWAFAAVLLLLCVSPLLYSTTESVNFHRHRRFLQQRAVATVPDERRGPAHQNPAQAPPEPLLPDALVKRGEAGEALENPELPSARLSGRAAYLASREVHQSFALGKRDALRCDDGPCVDGSCCSKDRICGFGPDFCGDGCRSQCDATAMCGEFSENGEMPCGMKLCCSAMGWCGTTASYCHNADPLRGSLPCQAGYGACYITPEPTGCPYGGGSTSGRHVGYYQSWNVRNRVCNRVSPSQLNTTGYTHLFYSFASVNPSTHRIAPAHSDDDAMMREFTALARNGLQTWIAVGGFDFSDEGTPTHTTWSDLCATKASRTAFISSVKDYMDAYGFQGVDLDWEYPGDPKRGGNKLADVRNLVLLVREMRLAYGSAYGISLTLAPDYWYLRWFDAKALEPYVDFFGFMAYDLHGSWDADVLTLGKKVRGQADIREIASNTVPLWFDGLNMAKINFGLAMYGRGYTLADPTCNRLLCPFDRASKPAPCTNFEGVMSLLEIQQLIKRRGLTPQYLPDSMMKQITWDDQWIGYDDEETFSAKRAWADSKCFGGTMVWSIDFQVSGSGDSDDEKYGEVVYVGSEVYQQPTAQCSPPCVMVMPPSTLEQSWTVITMEPYTATLQVGSTTTRVVATPAPSVITVSVINYFNYYVTSAQLPGVPLTLRPSFSVPPAQVVVTGPDGTTTTRTVFPPPVGGPYSTTPGQEPGGGDEDEPTDGWPWVPGPTATLETGENQQNEVAEETVTPRPTISSSTTEVIWPTGVIEPVTDQSKPAPPGSTRVSCTSWFFFICISWIELDIKVDFWDIVLPPGTIGPGPPPVSLLKFPPGWRVGCGLNCLPPWPKMTVNPAGEIVSVPPKPGACKPTSAILTIETTLYGTTTTQGTVSTTATRSFSSEFPIVGCAVEDVSISSIVTSCEVRVAAPTPRAVAGRAGDSESGSAVVALDAESEGRVVARAGEGCTPPEIVDAVLFPADHKAMSTLIQARLAWDKNDGKLVDFNVIDAPAAGFTAFIYLTRVRKDYLENELVGKFGMSDSGIIITADIEPPPAAKRSPAEDAYYDDNTTPYHNDTETGKHNLGKRISSLGKWNPSMISVPPKIGWLRAGSEYVDRTTSPPTYKYQRDASECGGQYVYISEDAIQTTAFGHANVETLTSQDYGIWRANSVDSLGHATRVASMVVGKENGVCPLGKATLVTTVLGPRFLRWNPERNAKSSYLKLLESLVMMLQDIKSKGRQGKAVINMSWSVLVDGVVRSCLLQILQELDKLNTVLVTSAGNEGKVMYRYPNLFEDDGLNNLIVVGAVNSFGEEASFSDMGIQLTVHAPGKDVQAANLDGSLQAESGTSYSSPMVAGLVAYFRALPGFGSQLEDPARVKMLVKKMRRSVQILNKPHSRPNKPVIWNGQLSDEVTCITLGDTPPGCPKIDIDDETPLDDLVCATANGLAVRQMGGSCPIDPGNGGGGGGQPSQGPTKIITYNSGTPSPTCTSGCGKLCTDYWCRPDRTGQPVHFTDPTNMPNTTAPWDGGGGGGSIPTNCTVSTVTQTCNGLGGNRSCRPLTFCLTTDISTAPPPSSAYCIGNTGCSEPFTDISTAAPPTAA